MLGKEEENFPGSTDQFSPINAALLVARTRRGRFLVKGLCKRWGGRGLFFFSLWDSMLLNRVFPGDTRRDGVVTDPSTCAEAVYGPTIPLYVLRSRSP